MEESMGALSDLVRQGKALYVGISNYSDPGTAAEAVRILKENGTPCLIHQPRYNMLEREAEEGLFAVLEENGVGCICYSPLAQGVLTNKYRQGIPAGSRAARGGSLVDRYMKKEQLETVAALEECAARRGRTMAQLALSWVLRRKEVTSVLIGASSPEQLDDNVAVLKDPAFTPEEERLIDTILGWKQEN